MKVQNIELQSEPKHSGIGIRLFDSSYDFKWCNEHEHINIVRCKVRNRPFELNMLFNTLLVKRFAS